MKKRSLRLKKILSVAEAEERSLGMRTGRAQRKMLEENRKLGELNAYRENYAAKARSANALSSAHFKDYQNFLSRLDQAVRSQQQVVNDCAKNLELHRRRWLVKRQRVESLERVRERYREQELAHEDRIEQRKLDDLPGAASPYDKDQ
ncbi:MAG: flagellar export protein FliJ [Woeseiaceae bacterium]|nr:flagellar export protein FliJ [Woeseiaceae bacterium]